MEYLVRIYLYFVSNASSLRRSKSFRKEFNDGFMTRIPFPVSFFSVYALRTFYMGEIAFV